MTYKLHTGVLNGINYVTRNNLDGSVTSFSFAPDNSDFVQFKKDLANGAELFDADGKVIDGIAYLEELV